MSDPFIPWIPSVPPGEGREFYAVDRAPTTAAPAPSSFTAEGLKAAFNAMEAIETLGLSLGEVTFVDAPEFAPGAVAVLLDGEAFAWMSAEKFAEFRRRVAKEGL